MAEAGTFERHRIEQLGRIRAAISTGLAAEGELAGGHIENVATQIVHELLEAILKVDLKVPGAQETVMRLASEAQTARRIYHSMVLAVQRGRGAQLELKAAAEKQEAKEQEGGDSDE